VRTEEDVAQIFGRGGALEAFVEAKEKGLTRFIGVTGHQDPLILRRCIEAFDFDTVLLPVNPAESAHKSFIDEVIPLAIEKEMGIIGMKVYLRGLVKRAPGFKGMESFFRFALSQPVSTAVIGCDNIRQLEENVSFARSFQRMSEQEMTASVEGISPYAKKLMYYKP
jgi:predicted aldo/keto reductase-like oxidoreductase